MILLRAFGSIWDFINYLFGTTIPSVPPQMYGFCMAIAFVVGINIGQRELKRRTQIGIFSISTKEVIVGQGVQWMDILLYGIFGYIFGLKIGGIMLNNDLLSQDPQHYFLSFAGSVFGGLIGFFIVASYFYWHQSKTKLPQPTSSIVPYPVEDRMGDILMIAMIGGILGSKIMDAIDNPNSMAQLLTNPIASMTSGLSVLGGLWLVSILFFLYARKNNIAMLPFADALSPAFFISYAIGRLGCQFSGDGCWGIASASFDKPNWIPNFLWGSTYPHNVNNDGLPIPNCIETYCHELPVAHFPTPIYETMIVTLLFVIIWILRKRLTHYYGAITGLFLIFNGLERFFIEFIRENTKYTYFSISLSQAQYISLAMMLIGAILMYWAIKIQFISKTSTHDIK